MLFVDLIKKIPGKGKDNKYSFEHELFNICAFTGFVSALFVSLTELFYFKDVPLAIVIGTIMLFCFLSYYFSRFKDKYNRVLYVITIHILLCIAYFLDHGINGPELMAIFMILLINTILLLGREKLVVNIILISILIIVFTLEAIVPELVRQPHEFDYLGNFKYKLIFFIVVLSFLFAIGYLRDQFEKERTKNLKQKEEIQHQNILLREQKDKIEKESGKRINFFINLAHETRTPLTLINNYLDCYIQKVEKSNDLDIIKRNIEKLNGDMLAFMDAEKLHRGLTLYDHENVSNFSEILKDKLQIFNELAQKNDITISEEIHSDIILKADPGALERLINNLLENALKFTDSGGEIKIALSVENSQLTFIVEDTGIGMSPDQKSKIFEPFYQITKAKSNNKGIGVGLSIVKNVVDTLNGEIVVESEPGRGTKFIISLPVNLADKSSNIPRYSLEESINFNAKKQDNKDSDFSKNRHNILIVEDNLDMLTFLKNGLSGQYNVFVAENGQVALDKMKHIPLPHLIISDIMMDIMDGYEFVRSLKYERKYDTIPIIFLTAKTTYSDQLLGLQLGAIDFILKPFKMELLNQKVEAIIKNTISQKEKVLSDIVNTIYDASGLDKEPETKDTRNNAYNYERYNITVREREIIHFMSEGLSNKEIGEKLHISGTTVAKHIQNIYKKTEINSRVELLKKFT